MKEDLALMDFLEHHAADYQDVDALYRLAEGEGLVASRKQFESRLNSLLKEHPDRFYAELPFKHHYTKIVSPRGKKIGLLKVSRKWRKEIQD